LDIPRIRIDQVSKSFGAVQVIKDLSLDIERGEFVSLLGPSGSGKTTLLMLLAGFEQPTAGSIVLDGRRIDHLPPHRREMGVVFQNYALFPHMSVADNVAFPLKMRGVGRAEIEGRVTRALDTARKAPFLMTTKSDRQVYQVDEPRHGPSTALTQGISRRRQYCCASWPAPAMASAPRLSGTREPLDSPRKINGMPFFVAVSLRRAILRMLTADDEAPLVVMSFETTATRRPSMRPVPVILASAGELSRSATTTETASWPVSLNEPSSSSLAMRSRAFR